MDFSDLRLWPPELKRAVRTITLERLLIDPENELEKAELARIDADLERLEEVKEPER